MRDRLVELLPLLLVAAILFVFFLTRSQGPAFTFLAPVTSSTCNPAAPAFVGELALLKASLGEQMGDPVECERVVDNDGNTQQRTTRGLAYFRKKSDAACFTTGTERWARKTDRGVVYWRGDAVDPPPNALLAMR